MAAGRDARRASLAHMPARRRSPPTPLCKPAGPAQCNLIPTLKSRSPLLLTSRCPPSLAPSHSPSLLPVMNWSDGDVWYVTLDVPAGRHEFKMVVANGDGSFDWEGGPNRSLQARAGCRTAGLPARLSCRCRGGSKSSRAQLVQQAAAPALGAGPQPQHRNRLVPHSCLTLQVLGAVAASRTAFTVSCDEGECPASACPHVLLATGAGRVCCTRALPPVMPCRPSAPFIHSAAHSLLTFNPPPAPTLDPTPAILPAEPGAAAMSATNGHGHGNGNGNGNGNGLSLASTLLRNIDGYVADGILSQEEASNFSADQLDFLIRKRTKDRRDREREDKARASSPAAALSRWAGLAPSSEVGWARCRVEWAGWAWGEAGRERAGC